MSIQQIDPINDGITEWLSDWASLAPTTNQGTSSIAFQRWFHFKEAFSPSFVRDVINSQSKKPKNIVDPFCGSGTTTLTAQFLGIEPTTIEVNPFLADLAEVKFSTFDTLDLYYLKQTLVKKAKEYRSEQLIERYPMPPTFVEPGKNNRWLFNREIAISIFSYRAAIGELEDSMHKKIAIVALGSILVKCSNAVVNGKGRRYRKNWEVREIPDVDNAMEEILLMMMEDASLSNKKLFKDYSLLRGDAREQLSKIDREIDLVLFSPPYPNSFDYTDVYNIELWMLGYLRSSDDNRKLRSNTLRSHVQVQRTLDFDISNSKTFANVYKQLTEKREKLWDKKLPEMVGAYFEDLTNILSTLGQKLSSDGRIEMVVGDSQYADTLIPVPQILSEIIQMYDLEVEHIKPVRSMRSSPQQGGKLHLPESLVSIRRTI